MKYLLFPFLLFLLSMVACSKPNGCKDSKALNYNPEAANSDGSCRYPTLSVDFDLMIDNTPFEINRIYQINGKATAFKQMQFYTSNIRITRPGKPTLSFPDTYGLVRADDPTVALGTIEIDSLAQLRLDIGLDPTANSNINQYLNNSSHPLRLQSPDTMHWNNNQGYIFLKLVGNVDRNGDGIPNENERFSFEIGTNPLLRSLFFPVHFTPRAEQNSMRLKVDIAKFLAGVDLQTVSQSHTFDNLPIATQIADNISTAIQRP